MLLVLDLDETLVHASLSEFAYPSDFCVGPYHVVRRPCLDAFLAYAFAHFEVGVWTSASGEYAAAIVGEIFADFPAPAFVWSRSRCTRRVCPETGEVVWWKKLKKLKKKGYALEQVLMVDDSPEKHEKNYGNLVRVSPFWGDVEDRVLQRLPAYLERLGRLDDVRRVDKRNWHKE